MTAVEGAGRRRAPPALNIPAVVAWVVGALPAVHLFIYLAPTPWANALFAKLAFIPARYSIPGGLAVDPVATLLSPVGHALLHGGLFHLLANSGMLLAFGAILARALGGVWFLAFCLLGVVAGAAALFLAAPFSLTPAIGASAAVSAVTAGVVVGALTGGGNRVMNRGVAARLALIWIALNLLPAVLPDALFGGAQIAWEAHFGGAAAGALLALPAFGLRRRG